MLSLSVIRWKVWKIANGEVYAVVTDTHNNPTYKCLQQPLAGKPRQAYRRGDPHKAPAEVNAIHEYWPDKFDGEVYLLSAEGEEMAPKSI